MDWIDLCMGSVCVLMAWPWVFAFYNGMMPEKTPTCRHCGTLLEKHSTAGDLALGAGASVAMTLVGRPTMQIYKGHAKCPSCGDVIEFTWRRQ